MSNRVCKKCNIEKRVEEFARAGTINNKNYFRHICSSCYTDYKKPRRLKIRNKYKEYKKTLSCCICGFSDYRALQFHHIDSSNKNFNIACAVNGSHGWETVLEEIKKCKVLCANCHQIEHYKD